MNYEGERPLNEQELKQARAVLRHETDAQLRDSYRRNLARLDLRNGVPPANHVQHFVTAWKILREREAKRATE